MVATRFSSDLSPISVLSRDQDSQGGFLVRASLLHVDMVGTDGRGGTERRRRFRLTFFSFMRPGGSRLVPSRSSSLPLTPLVYLPTLLANALDHGCVAAQGLETQVRS